jgi:hypothetical protein
MSEAKKEIKVKVICCDVPQYMALFMAWTTEMESIEGIELLEDFKNVQLIQNPGNPIAQPKIIHVIYYSIPYKAVKVISPNLTI